jgi:type II secretory pathway pseudopilin PulG
VSPHITVDTRDVNRLSAFVRRVRTPRRDRPRDAGLSMIEIVVSVTLLGTGGVSMLGAMTATVTASAYERDHSRAQVWLQSAIEELQAADRQGCDQGEETVRANYLSLLRAEVINPPGWADSQLTIEKPVKAWDGEKYWDPYDTTAPATCFDNQGFKLQLITIVVTNPDGKVIEQVSVVKG